MTDLIVKAVFVCIVNMPTTPGDGVISWYCKGYVEPDPTPPAKMEYAGMVFGSWRLPDWIEIRARETRRPTT